MQTSGKVVAACDGLIGDLCGDGGASTIVQNTTVANAGDGINAGPSLVADNNSSNNVGDQIETSGLVRGNLVSSRNFQGWGLLLLSDASYIDNAVRADPGSNGTVSGGVNVSGNVCNGGACP